MSKPPKIRLLVVDDHFIIRIGLMAALNAETDMTVVAEASNGSQAVKLYRQHRPEVVLMDMRLPDKSGAEVTAEICQEFPEARVLLLSHCEGAEDIHQALAAGARGYLFKTVLDNELTKAIRAVQAGAYYLPPAVAACLAERAHRVELSARELEVLKLVVNGCSNKEIASHLGFTEHTAKAHLKGILGKLGVRDRTEAATFALKQGIVHLD
jgi:DNA-binding NarL/FixJ family response regulator